LCRNIGLSKGTALYLFSVSKTLNRAVPAQFEQNLQTQDWSHGPFAAQGWTVTTWSDKLLCQTEASPLAISLIEAVPRRGPGPRIELVSIKTHEQKPLLIIRRSPNGGRPVFYYHAPDGALVLSSHLSLLRAWGVPLVERANMLPELYTYRQICPPFTLIADVMQLAAGDHAEAELEGNRWKLYRKPSYMPPPFQAKYALGADEPALISLMRDRLEASMLDTGIDCAGTGCLLSGGLDSSIITSIVRRHQGLADTVSSVYPFEDISTDVEYRYATSAAQALGTQHYVHLPTMSDYLHGTVDAIAIAEEPLMHLQSVLIHLILKDVLRPRNVTVVPCGEGADGLFGGRLQKLLTTFAAKPSLQLALQLPGVAPLLRQISARTNRWGLIAQIADKKISSITSFADPKHILWTLAVFGDRQWIKDNLHCSDVEMIGGRPECMVPFLGRDLRDCASILALLSESSETQVIWNKLGEAAGMCVTYPYLDQSVSDLAYSIPWEAKLAGAKPILRAVARDMGIPESIVARPKASFDINPERWGPRGGVFEPLLDLAKAVIDEPILRSLQSTYVFRAHTLWTALNYAIWVRLHIRNEPLDTLHAELDRSMERLGVASAYRASGRVQTRHSLPGSQM